MSLNDKKGINLNSGFKLIAESPLDVRTVVDKEIDKDELIKSKAAYIGIIVYVKESKKTYQYNGDGNWDVITKGERYVHPTGDGNLHVPATGTNSDGRLLMAGDQPGKIFWTEATPKTIGAATEKHTHVKTDITDFPNAMKNPNELIVSLDGNSQSYDGSAEKTINITPESINASRNNHTHLYAGSTSVGGAAKSANKLTTPVTINLSNNATGSASFDGSTNVDIPVTIENIDASVIQTGVLDIARIPKAALERCIVVKDDNARFNLTIDDVQKGDTVKVSSTKKMYFIVDDSKLNSEEGYEPYIVEPVPWSGITDKPSEYNPSAHTHTKADITDFPESLKNPKQLTISLNGNSSYSYDGSGARTINITPDSIGASAKTHSHSYAGSNEAGGAANSVANPITILLDNTSTGAYNGSSAKEINITPEAINASRNNHTHTISDITGLDDITVDTAKKIDVYDNNNSDYTPMPVQFANNSDVSDLIMTVVITEGQSGRHLNGVITDAKNKLSVKHAASADTATSATSSSSADKVSNALIIELGGLSQGSWDGSITKTINITPAAIGAAAANHTHEYIPLTGSSNISGHIYPKEDAVYNLGVEKRRWNYGYINKCIATQLTVENSACVNGDLEVTGAIKNGEYFNSVTNADYAEAFNYSGDYPELGTIVELCGDRKVKTASGNSNKVIGVVSDTYCILAGADKKLVENKYKVAIGLLGQIPVKCIGIVHTGDFIISANNGIGIASPNPDRGSIIGRAMENKTTYDTGMVLCLVSPQ